VGRAYYFEELGINKHSTIDSIFQDDGFATTPVEFYAIYPEGAICGIEILAQHIGSALNNQGERILGIAI
jgi:hypothetical protein